MDRRTFLASCATTASAGLAGCTGRDWARNDPTVSEINEGPPVALRPVVTGLDEPVAYVDAPRADVAYVAERKGRIRVVEDGAVRETPLLDLRDRLANLRSWEQGLLGLALHPEFASNGRLFVRYSAPLTPEMPDDYSHAFVLAEFQIGANRRRANPNAERRLLEIPQPGAWHQSGAIEFGPDGYLYVGVGDGGAPRSSTLGGYRDFGRGHAEDWYATNVGGNGQDVTENLLGSILRINVDSRDGDHPYGVPSDNPLVGTEGLDEHYAWGFRNPFRLSVEGDRLFVGDVGSFAYEEVDVVQAGGNYGWNVREGPACFNAQSTLVDGVMNDLPAWLRERIAGTPLAAVDTALRQASPERLQACPQTAPNGRPLVDPVITYPHERNGEPVGSAVIGGHVAHDATVDAIDGRYVFGDLMAGRSGRLFVADPDQPQDARPWPIQELRIANTESGRVGAAVLSFARDAAGHTLVLASRFGAGTGTIYRIDEPA